MNLDVEQMEISKIQNECKILGYLDGYNGLPKDEYCFLDLMDESEMKAGVIHSKESQAQFKRQYLFHYNVGKSDMENGIGSELLDLTRNDDMELYHDAFKQKLAQYNKNSKTR